MFFFFYVCVSGYTRGNNRDRFEISVECIEHKGDILCFTFLVKNGNGGEKYMKLVKRGRPGGGQGVRALCELPARSESSGFQYYSVRISRLVDSFKRFMSRGLK